MQIRPVVVTQFHRQVATRIGLHEEQQLYVHLEIHSVTGAVWLTRVND